MRARIICYGVAALMVFGTLFHTVSLRNRAVATAYRVRELRDDEAELRNVNDLLASDVAARSRIVDLQRNATRVGLSGLEPGTVAVETKPRKVGVDETRAN